MCSAFVNCTAVGAIIVWCVLFACCHAEYVACTTSTTAPTTLLLVEPRLSSSFDLDYRDWWRNTSSLILKKGECGAVWLAVPQRLCKCPFTTVIDNLPSLQLLCLPPHDSAAWDKCLGTNTSDEIKFVNNNIESSPAGSTTITSFTLKNNKNLPLPLSYCIVARQLLLKIPRSLSQPSGSLRSSSRSIVWVLGKSFFVKRKKNVPVTIYIFCLFLLT